MRGLLRLGIGCALLGACEGGGEDSGEAADDSGADATGDPTEGAMVPLTRTMAWQPVSAAEDPLADHRPAQVICPLGGWLTEVQGIEVNTVQCNYGMFGQPALVGVAKGARVTGSLYHFDLVAAEPASAHAALLIGDDVVWEQTIAIPGKANAFTIEVTAPAAVPAGTPVYFHLHNHGQNTWTFAEVMVET